MNLENRGTKLGNSKSAPHGLRYHIRYVGLTDHASPDITQPGMLVLRDYSCLRTPLGQLALD